MTKGEWILFIAVFAIAIFTALYLRKQCETAYQRNEALQLIVRQ